MKLCISFFSMLFAFSASLVSAQTVTVAPSAALFTLAEADMAKALGFQLDFFQCASVTFTGTPPVATCQGRAASPFQSGVQYPKSAVTGPVDQRRIDFSTPPISTFLPSLPIGTAFVGVLRAIGDPNQGGVPGPGAPSNDSNPFYRAGQTLAAPTNFRLVP